MIECVFLSSPVMLAMKKQNNKKKTLGYKNLFSLFWLALTYQPLIGSEYNLFPICRHLYVYIGAKYFSGTKICRDKVYLKD